MRMDSDRRSRVPPVTPHPRLVELLQRRKLRKRIETIVDKLVEVLDALDDPEAEPSLGAQNVIFPSHFDQRRWSDGATDDREDGQGDDEPSLGAPIAADHDQTGWARGASNDREADHYD